MAKPKKPAAAPPKKPAPAKAAPEPQRSLDDIDVERATARVKALRLKFDRLLDDPDAREAMVRYLQSLLRESKRIPRDPQKT